MPGTCIGLMSGTSMDAVDAALCRIRDGRVSRIEATHSCAYAPALRQRLLDLQGNPDAALTLREVAGLDHAIAEAFAAAAIGVMRAADCDAAEVDAIGSHGQTLFHDPTNARNSLQLGDPNLIAARTGVRVVADFRRADIARGGQGAPLVPGFHQSAFEERAPCAVLNIGGIANVTVLAGSGAVSGFDTGPGNALMDDWSRHCRGEPFDRDGRWAAGGRVDAQLLHACLADGYFLQPPPKSTGRDRFSLAWLRRLCADLDARPAADVQRTLCELTAQSIALQMRHHAGEISRLYVCGGGSRNRQLMASLRATLPGIVVETTQAAGIEPDVVECAAFAWLAWRRINDLPGNVPTVTGASGPAILGAIYSP